MRRLIYIGLISLVVGVSGCAHQKLESAPEGTGDIFERAQRFYTFLTGREIGVWHNDRDEKFRAYFLDRDNYYDFMDSFIYILRDRDIYRNRVSHFFIQGIELSEDGSQATVKVKFLSRDAYLIYRKIDATHEWEKTYDKWYPKKINAPELNWRRKYTQRYGLPPGH